MNVYTFAMKMEKDGEEYYRELANKSNTQGLVKIFNMLADEEVTHFQVIEKLSKKVPLPDVGDSESLRNVKNIFEEMRDNKLNFEMGHYVDTTEETIAYRKARDIEKESMDFYLKKAEETEDKQFEQIMKKLAAEEEKHFHIMNSIVEFVSRPEPGNWLEDAEWHHLDEY